MINESNATSERITLDDSLMSAMIKMAGGNPGAVTALMALTASAPKVDPDSFLKELAPILSLDTYHIYEEKIWMLYKDVCKGDVVNVHAILRACQLGYITEKSMHHGIDNYGDGLDLDEIRRKVSERLDNFNLNYVARPRSTNYPT